jgi:hypothetical protein
MNHKYIFLKEILPAEICPILYEDVTLEELVTLDLFIKEVYEEITENNEIAVISAVKFWLYKPKEAKLSFRTLLYLMPGMYKYMTIYKNHEAIACCSTVDYYIKNVLIITK